MLLGMRLSMLQEQNNSGRLSPARSLKVKLLIGTILIIFATDIVILLDIPFLRQILGFIFLTILPGFLILHHYQ
jgi:uncharacterized membrane protein